MRVARLLSRLAVGAGIALYACKVYDSSLLESGSKKSPVPPEQWGSGIGWWSTKNESGCIAAGLPTVDDRPTNAPSGDIGELVFAVRSMALGSLDRNGEATVGAWKNLGFDLDGLCTNSPTCDPGDNAFACESPTAAVAADGNECRDNTFGRLEADAIALQGLGKKYGLSNDGFNCALCHGDYNFLFRITGWNGTPNDANVRIDIYPSPGLEATPTSWACSLTDQPGAWKPNGCWASTDKWTIQTKSYEGDLGATGPLPNAYLNDPVAYVRENYVVAQLPENTNFWFPGKSAAWAYPLKLQRGVVVGKLVKVDGAWKLTDGTIAGRARTSDLIQSFEELGLCQSDPLYSVLTTNVNINTDVLFKGVNSEEAVCDAISVGIGFDAEQAEFSRTPRDAVTLPGCPPVTDGGVDSGTGGTSSDASTGGTAGSGTGGSSGGTGGTGGDASSGVGGTGKDSGSD